MIFTFVSRIETPDLLNQKQLEILVFHCFILVMMISFCVTMGWLTIFNAMALAMIILLITKVVDAEDVKRNAIGSIAHLSQAHLDWCSDVEN